MFQTIMKKSKKFKTIIIILALILLFIFSIEIYKNGQENNQSNQTLIGGERDENGCLLAAGYSFNETYGLCVRQWELKEKDVKILNIAKDYYKEEYGLTYVNSIKESMGNYVVLLDTLGSPRTLDVYSPSLIDKVLTPEKCLSMQGTLVNILERQKCLKNESLIGRVDAFITPNICCAPYDLTYCTPDQRNVDACITLWEPVCGYPAEETFSNSCLACSSEQIEYYIEGECDEIQS